MPLLDKLIWQIEMRMHQPVALTDLSDVCAISPYHMARLFRIAVGIAPITYLRARRLSVAAEGLARGEDILTVALNAQYTSHEAFTRAFSSYFGVLPSSVRKARSTQSLTLMEPLKMQKEMIVDVPAPRMETRTAFRVIGLAEMCSFENNSAIPGLWQKFNAREDEIDNRIDNAAYGVCCDADGQGNFRYVAGVAATIDATKPKGMQDTKIPAGAYAVFTHSGHIADFGKTVYTIWNKSLPETGLEPRFAPDFEVYDSRFDARTGQGEVEIWIPVKAAT